MTSELSPAPREDWLDYPPPTPQRVAPGASLRIVLQRVFVDPVRDGFPTWRVTPAGFAAIMIAAVIGFGVALLLVCFAPWLTAPLRLVWLQVVLLIVAVALLQTAALHTPWWGRVLGLATSTIYLCAVGLGSGTDVGVRADLMIITAALLTLAALSALRGDRRFSWWEFVVVLLVLTAATVLPTIDVVAFGLSSGPGGYLDFTETLLINIGLLAAPIVLAAGYAIAQFGYTAVVWGVDAVRAAVPMGALVVLLIMVVIWRLYAEGRAWWESRIGSEPQILTALGLLITCLIVWSVLDAIADRVRAGSTMPVDLGRDLQRVVVAIAVLLTLDLLLQLLALSPPGYLAQLLSDAGQSGAAGAVGAVAEALREVAGLLGGRPARLGLALLIMAAGIWRAAQGDRGTAELLGIVTTLLIFGLFFGIEPTTTYLPLLVVIIVLGLTVVWASARVLTPQRVEALLAAALLSWFFGFRDIFTDPQSIVLGASVAVIFGLGWSFLTGGEATRQDGADFPRPSRLLLFAGAALLGATAVAHGALLGGPTRSFDANALAGRGDSVLGGALLIGAMVAVILAAVRDQEVGEPG
jgi:hypothetical protein